MLSIDGSLGEGGGQILRTSLALSTVTGTPFRISNIRARRRKPGLMRQHLTACRAAMEVCGASAEGCALGSTELTFAPGAPRGLDYHFDVGSAGSVTLVLQTVLPALLTATAPSRLVLEGGTHNPMAPPYDFIEKTFLPLLRRMGARVRAILDRPGFYPAGGGKMRVEIDPVERLTPIELVERGPISRQGARAVVSRLPLTIAEREIKVLRRMLGWKADRFSVGEIGSSGPGNVVLIEVQSDALTEVIAAFGEKGVRAETVAERAGAETRLYIDSGVPVGSHLADQLLIPMAMAGAGVMRTLPLTGHTVTNMDVVARFLPVDFTVSEPAPGVREIAVKQRGG